MTSTFHLHEAGSATEYVLTNVQKFRMSKRSDLMVLSMPGDDSDATYADDMDGVTRKISLEGYKQDTLANIGDWAFHIFSMIDGAQMEDATRHQFHSIVPVVDTGNAEQDYTVAVENFEIELDVETPANTLCKYRIEMTQTAT